MKIAITHSTQENPVAGGGTSLLPPRWEEQLTEPIADRAADLLRQLGYDARSDWPHTRVGDVITAVNAWGADLVVDIHTDAFNGQAYGTSAFWYPGSARGEQLGRALAAHVSAVSGKLRGAYPRPDLGILASTRMVAALVELDFHDSLDRALRTWQHRFAYARAVAQAILDVLGDARALPGEADSLAATTPKPQPPAATPAPARLRVDGVYGPATKRRLQDWLGITVDGIVGPQTIRALQRRLRVTVDGQLGPQTIRALQRLVGVTVDGVWGRETTRGLQRYLNGIGSAL